jgi:hypothetical protein
MHKFTHFLNRAAKIANATHGGDRSTKQAANLQLASRRKAGVMLNVSERLIADAATVRRTAAPESSRRLRPGAWRVHAKMCNF